MVRVVEVVTSSRLFPETSAPVAVKARLAPAAMMDVAGGSTRWFSGPAVTLIVIDPLTASGATALVAFTAKLNKPFVVGVPDSTPVLGLRFNPPGRFPFASANAGAG